MMMRGVVVEEGKMDVVRRRDFSRDPTGELRGDALTEKKEGNVDSDSTCKDIFVVDSL